MIDSLLDLLLSGLWLIPLVILGAILVVVLLVRSWKKKGLQELKLARNELRRLDQERKQLAAGLQGYSAEDPLPFGPQVATLQSQIRSIEAVLIELQAEYVSLQEHIRASSGKGWRSLFGAPYLWYGLRQDIAALIREVHNQAEGVAAAQASRQVLDRLAWDVAQRFRQVGELQQQVDRYLERFQQRNLQGDSFDSAISQAETSRLALAEVPGYFLTADEPVVLEQTDKNGTIAVYEILVAYQPGLEQLLEQLHAWEEQHAQTAAAVSSMRRALSSLEQNLSSLPASLDAAEEAGQVPGMLDIARTLNDTLSRLEVESMPLVLAEAQRLQDTCQEMDGLFRQARQELTELERVLPELNERLKTVSEMFSRLGTSKLYPVIWDQSSPRLTRLSQRTKALGLPGKPRRPRQLKQELETAVELNAECTALQNHCQGIQQQHSELLAIITSPDFSEGMGWYQETLKLVEQVQIYDPDNWPRIDGVTRLPAQLDALADGLDILAGGAATQPIQEAQVAISLDDAQQLSKYAQGLKTRVANIQRRLGDVQQAERAARESLDKSAASLSLVTALVHSNPFLDQAVGKESVRLQDKLDSLEGELTQRQNGTLDRKLKACESLATSLELSVSQWSDRLATECTVILKKMSVSLAAMDEIAPVDDAAVAEARRLLGDSAYDLATGVNTSPRSMDALLQELKRRSEFWARCTAASKALEEVAGPVTQAYQQAREDREFIRKQLDETGVQLRQRRSWPPTSITLTAERREAETLERQWAAMKNEPVRVVNLVSTLSGLAARYQALADRVSQAAGRFDQEQQEVSKLEEELEEYRLGWEANLREYRSNEMAGEEINELLTSLDSEHKQIRQQYQNGAKTYDQVLQSLRQLIRKARVAQVQIDEQHAVDVHGGVITRREASLGDF